MSSTSCTGSAAEPRTELGVSDSQPSTQSARPHCYPGMISGEKLTTVSQSKMTEIL